MKENWRTLSDYRFILEVWAVSTSLYMSALSFFIFYFLFSSNKILLCSEEALQRCPYKKVFWKYVANLLEKTNAEVQFQ